MTGNIRIQVPTGRILNAATTGKRSKVIDSKIHTGILKMCKPSDVDALAISKWVFFSILRNME